MVSKYLITLILMISLLMLVGCGQEETEIQQRLRSIKYQEIESISVDSSRTFSGVAKGSLEANLSFRVDGTIDFLPVKIGNHLKAGQLIARLDASQYELQVQQSQASLAQSMAALRNARAAFERLKGLYENNNISRHDLDAARASADSSHAQVRASQKNLELSQLQLSYTQLKSNQDCDIAEVYVENKENVTSGQNIVKVSCGQQMEVEITVPDKYVTLITPKMPAKVTFNTRPNKIYMATVTEVGVASSGGTAFPVTVVLDNTPKDLRSGMAAETTFIFNNHSASQIFVVPPIAISEDMQGRFAYIVEPLNTGNAGIIKRRSVTVGELTDGGLEIMRGLHIGDRVVTAGVSVIRDGLQVKLD